MESLFAGLSKAQKRHLREMVGASGHSRFWRPNGSGEQSCAYALRKKGLLKGSFVTLNDGFELTDDGMRIARALLENPNA